MISSVEAEVLSQPKELGKWQSAVLERAPEGSLFVGAGDSLVASGIVNNLTSMRYLVLDPYELLLDPGLAKGKQVYFISVSGRTASNVAASEAVEYVASRRTAITANPKGPLARATDSRILIPYRLVPRIPGTLSFTLCLLTILRLALGEVRIDFGRVATGAEWKQFALSEHAVNHFIGNGPSFPLCQYAALKTHEILGWTAQATALEEFGHSTLFCLGRRDTVNVLSTFDPLNLSSKLCRELGKQGYASALVRVPAGSVLEQVFSSVFAVQLAVVRKAESLGLRRPYFATARKKLAVSDAMIYRKARTA